LRVALISSEYAGLAGSGGIGSYFANLVRGFSGRGCEVEVFTSGNQGDLLERKNVWFHHLGDASPPLFALRVVEVFQKVHSERPFDILEYGELKAEGLWVSRSFPEVARVVRLHSPSVILDRYLDFAPSPRQRAFDIFNQTRCALGALRRGLPLKSIQLEPFHFPWLAGRDFVEREAAIEADTVVVMSEEMRCFAEGHWWIKPEAIRKVPNPLFLNWDEGKKMAPNSTPKLGFLGRLEPRKGVKALALALNEVLPAFPDWVVEFAGRSMPSCISGIDPAQVVREILGKNLKQVRFVNNLPPAAVSEWLAGVDVFAFPSLWDNFPYVILEAMASGRPIVATQTGAVPEMLGDTAEIVKPGDVRGLAKALRTLMADAGLRVKLGAAARKRFEERFHPDQVMGEILEVYREAIERAKNRRKEV
jgi:glycosyltransferase involved in cell wall biosynthesis